MITVRQLVKKFDDTEAVRDVSFEVGTGEVFAFLGPNGAGKTTTIKILTTLLQPTRGTVLIDGLDPTKDRHEVRRRLGVVFQDQTLDTSLTAYENLELHGVLYGVPREALEERAQELLRAFELWNWRDSVVKKLSGGMSRRLEIARALLHRPKVLFLDEPTLGLDPQSREQLWAHVKALNAADRTTVFLTTHYMEEAARVAQRIAIIDHGSVVAQGSLCELLELTRTESLEAAFLALIGSTAREEEQGSIVPLRQFARAWSGKR